MVPSHFTVLDKLPLTPNAEEIEFEETSEAWGWAECTHAKVEEIFSG